MKLINNKIADQKEIQEFISRNDFGNAAKALLKLQKSEWPQLQKGYEAYKKIRTKSFHFRGNEIKAQFNPGRLESSSAKVDPESIKKRECFLCIENLPAGQRGILYKNEFIILANPFPIFPEHFTISCLKHTPQKILKNFRIMLQLGKDLSEYYTVFYNGPGCGASAPDHLHFQACTKLVMPLESELDKMEGKYPETLLQKPGELIYAVDDGMRKFFVVQSGEVRVLERIFNYLYVIMQEKFNSGDEPMMNLILSFNRGEWRLILFFREKHRPKLYDKGILWSPAAVDLGGICIFPVEEDLKVISEHDLVQGFNEVIISNGIFSYIKGKLKNLTM